MKKGPTKWLVVFAGHRDTIVAQQLPSDIELHEALHDYATNNGLSHGDTFGGIDDEHIVVVNLTTGQVLEFKVVCPPMMEFEELKAKPNKRRAK